jgi:hypothetical protein
VEGNAMTDEELQEMLKTSSLTQTTADDGAHGC